MSRIDGRGFLNVDLHLESACGFSQLSAAFGDLVVVLSSEGGSLCLELAEQPASPEEAVARFAALVACLQGEARREWNECARRILDVGIQLDAGAAHRCFLLPVATLTQAADISAGIAITAYSG